MMDPEIGNGQISVVGAECMGHCTSMVKLHGENKL